MSVLVEAIGPRDRIPRALTVRVQVPGNQPGVVGDTRDGRGVVIRVVNVSKESRFFSRPVGGTRNPVIVVKVRTNGCSVCTAAIGKTIVNCCSLSEVVVSPDVQLVSRSHPPGRPQNSRVGVGGRGTWNHVLSPTHVPLEIDFIIATIRTKTVP